MSDIVSGFIGFDECFPTLQSSVFVKVIAACIVIEQLNDVII